MRRLAFEKLTALAAKPPDSCVAPVVENCRNDFVRLTGACDAFTRPAEADSVDRIVIVWLDLLPSYARLPACLPIDGIELILVIDSQFASLRYFSLCAR